jgi:hypothetical protein
VRTSHPYTIHLSNDSKDRLVLLVHDNETFIEADLEGTMDG